MLSPRPLFPQQAMVPSVLAPHANRSPAATDVKVPDGGVAGTSIPQQAMVPSVLTPHAKYWPTLTDAKVPAGVA